MKYIEDVRETVDEYLDMCDTVISTMDNYISDGFGEYKCFPKTKAACEDFREYLNTIVEKDYDITDKEELELLIKYNDNYIEQGIQQSELLQTNNLPEELKERLGINDMDDDTLNTGITNINTWVNDAMFRRDIFLNDMMEYEENDK